MRIFRETDIFAAQDQDFAGHRILSVESSPGARLVSKPASIIENPFSAEFYATHTTRAERWAPDDFCVEVSDAVLYGERAVVTPDNLLITDGSCSPPGRINFHPEARRFEAMLPTGGMGEFLYSPRVDRPEIAIDDTAVLLSSWEHWNYGAVLIRELPKILDIRRLGLHGLPVISPGSPWHTQLLEVCGIANVIKHDRHRSYQVKNLIVPSQKSREFIFGPEVREFFQAMAASVADDEGEGEGDGGGGGELAELLYVSRLAQGRKNPGYRRCVNEEELIDALSRLGIAAIEPENLTIRQQIAAFRAARFVIGPSGAGMFNTVFCRPGTSVISIEPLPHWFWQHRNLFSSMDHSFGFVTGGAIEDDPEPVQKSWRADIAAVVRAAETMVRRLG